MTPRTPLPNRRPTLILDVVWNGHPLTVGVGYDLDGNPRDAFADTQRGGDMAATLNDTCVLISIALQHGIAPEALAKSLGRVPDVLAGGGATAPASPVGAVMEAVLAARLRFPRTNGAGGE